MLQFILMLCGAIYFGMYQFMATMARAKFDGSGNVLDGGIDLNMESGMAE